MKCRKTMIRNALFLMVLLGFSISGNAQAVRHDKQKEKQWQSMENGPWDFAPDWYYYFLYSVDRDCILFLFVSLTNNY